MSPFKGGFDGCSWRYRQPGVHGCGLEGCVLLPGTHELLLQEGRHRWGDLEVQESDEAQIRAHAPDHLIPAWPLWLAYNDIQNMGFQILTPGTPLLVALPGLKFCKKNLSFKAGVIYHGPLSITIRTEAYVTHLQRILSLAIGFTAFKIMRANLAVQQAAVGA